MKTSLRKHIFFLLVCVDPNTSSQYTDIDIDGCFNGLLLKLSGFNELLSYPNEIVTVMSLLQAALQEYHNSSFDFNTYRKLILDAGAEVLKLEEGD